MIKNFIEGDKIYLQELTNRINNPNYFKWLKNKDINKFLEVRFQKKISKNYVKKFIINSQKNKNIILFGIFKKNHTHIGNVKLEFNINHKKCELGILIGEKKYFGNGYGKDAIKLATAFIFKNTKIDFIYAGIYSNNFASIKSFRRSGWKKNSVLKEFWVYEDKRIDSVVYSITKAQFNMVYKK